MFIADYHCHSAHSPDARGSILELLQAAERLGLSELCVTDHCDLPVTWDLDAYLADMAALRRSHTGSCRLLFGLELGQATQYPEELQAVLARPSWDFLIGSLHEIRGHKDFYCLEYPDEAGCYRLLDAYFDELLELARQGGFDVLGHITYPLRYMCGRGGFRLEILGRYEGVLRRIFAVLRDSGKGLEVNLSGLYREGYERVTMPPPDVLALYRQCGGEIVTLGSDAHSAEQLGGALREGLGLVREAGFTHIATFYERKVRYEAI